MTFPFNAVNFMLLFTFGRLHHMLELFFCHDFTVVNYCSLWGEWEREEGREKEVQQDFFFPSQSILVITWIIPDFNDLSNKCMPTQSLLILHFQDDMCRAPWSHTTVGLWCPVGCWALSAQRQTSENKSSFQCPALQGLCGSGISGIC